MSRPRLELLVAPGTGGRVVALLESLSRWWEPSAPDRSLPSPVAVLATSPAAPRLAEHLGGTVPVLVWADPSDPPVDHLDPAPLAVLRPRTGSLEVRGRDISVPVPGIDAGASRPVPPFVRARWRRHLGLPEQLVAEVGLPGAPRLDSDELSTVLAVAAAVAATGEVVLRAMALGAAVATDEPTARKYGLEHVVVSADPVAAATELAADIPPAAQMGRAAREEVLRNHDLGWTARMVHRLVTGGAATGPHQRARGLLAELGASRHSIPSRRVEAALGTLPEPVAVR